MTELEAARALLTELEDLFRRASRQFRVAANNSNVCSVAVASEKERVILAGLYVGAADFVSRLGLLYAKRSLSPYLLMRMKFLLVQRVISMLSIAGTP